MFSLSLFQAFHRLVTVDSTAGRAKASESENLPFLRNHVDAAVCGGGVEGGPQFAMVIFFAFHPGRLQRTLPAGRSFVAMDTKDIPQILQQIFTSTMLSGV